MVIHGKKRCETQAGKGETKMTKIRRATNFRKAMLVAKIEGCLKEQDSNKSWLEKVTEEYEAEQAKKLTDAGCKE